MAVLGSSHAKVEPFTQIMGNAEIHVSISLIKLTNHFSQELLVILLSDSTHFCFGVDLFLLQDHANPMTTPARVRSRMADTTPRAAPKAVPMAVQMLLSTASVPSEPSSSLFESGRCVVSKIEVDLEHEVKSEHVMVAPFPAWNVLLITTTLYPVNRLTAYYSSIILR